MMKKTKINRRKFITDMSLKTIGAGFTISQFGRKSVWAETKKDVLTPAKRPDMEYRILGKTGLKVSAVGFGVMRLKEPSVLFKALDLGVNLFDTAHNYQNGNNEKMLGKVLKEYGRQKAIVVTKIHPFHMQRTLDKKFKMLETSELDKMMGECLTRLQSDYVDVLLVHNIMDTSWPMNEKVLTFLEKIKKEGKARFVGVSIHDPRYLVEVSDIIAKSNFYDVYLPWLNFKSPPEHLEAIKRTAKAGVGVYAMKTQAGGYSKGAGTGLTPHQAALRWVLQHDFISSTIPGMVNIEQLEENVASLEKKVGWNDRKKLHNYYQAVKNRYCVMCNGCSIPCDNPVDIHTINRAMMYYEGYGDFALAQSTYRQLTDVQNGLACLTCTAPTCRCINGIKLSQRATQAHVLFG